MASQALRVSLPPKEALERGAPDRWGSRLLEEDKAVNRGAGTVLELPASLPGLLAAGVAGRSPRQQLVPARHGAVSVATRLSWAPGILAFRDPSSMQKYYLAQSTAALYNDK